MAFKLAELFVSIVARDEQLKGALSKTHSDLVQSGRDAGLKSGEQYGQSFSKAAVAGMGLAAGIGSVLGGLVLRAAEAGWGKLKETWSETVGEAQNMARIMRVLTFTFGDAAAGMEKWGERTSEATGVAKAQLLETADRFGVVALRQGQSRQAAAEFGMQMARLAGDVQSASINTISYEGATNRLFMGMMRGGRGLMQLGISFTTQQVQMQAMAMGFEKVNGAFRQTDLQMARVALITKNLGLAQGDLESRQGTAGLMAKQTGQIWANIYEEVGKILLPAVGQWTRAQYEFAVSAKEAFENAKPYIESFTAKIAEGWGAIKANVLPIVYSLKDAIMDFSKTILSNISPATAALTGITIIGMAIGPPILAALGGIISFAAPVAAGIGIIYSAFRILEPQVSSVSDAIKILHTSWDTAASVFSRSKAIFVDAISALKDKFDSLFGAGSGSNIKDFMISAGESIKLVLRNLPEYAEIAFLSVYQKILDIGYMMKPAFLDISGYALLAIEKILHGFNYVMEHGLGKGLADLAVNSAPIFVDLAERVVGIFGKMLQGVLDLSNNFLKRLLDKMLGVNPQDNIIEQANKISEGLKAGAEGGDWNETPAEKFLRNLKEGGKGAESFISKMRTDIEGMSRENVAPDVTSSKILGARQRIALNEREVLIKDKKEQQAADIEAATSYFNQLLAEEGVFDEMEKKRENRRKKGAMARHEAIVERKKQAEEEKKQAKEDAFEEAMIEEEEGVPYGEITPGRRRKRRRRTDEGARDIATEGYAEKAPKLTDSAQFATDVFLSLLGHGGGDIQKEQLSTQREIRDFLDPQKNPVSRGGNGLG